MSRYLDIGPGWDNAKLVGFETLDIKKGKHVDHVADASGPLPFKDSEFDVIHACNILEHIFWRDVDETLKEWVRILKPGGVLEIWVPNALVAARDFIEAEDGNLERFKKQRSYELPAIKKDPCRAFNSRLLAYNCPYIDREAGIHKSIYSLRYLKKIMFESGLIDVKEMNYEKEYRMKNFRSGGKGLSMGVKGEKP